MESHYEKFIRESTEAGTIRYLDSPEDIEMMERMNKISEEIKEEYLRKERASEIAASKIYLD